MNKTSDFIDQLLRSPSPVNDLDERTGTVGSFGVTEMLSRAGIQNIDRLDVAALILVCEWGNFDAERVSRGQLVENHFRPVTSVDSLKSWLGCLGTYRYIQKKVQVKDNYGKHCRACNNLIFLRHICWRYRGVSTRSRQAKDI